jgi:hypothetical protein
MEERLLDSSKYKISLVSLDSRYASQIDCEKGEFKIVLPRTMKNVMRIRMASAEIPLVEYVFSLENGNTTFAVRLAANTTFVKCNPIPDGNYTSAKLVTAIESSLKNIHNGFTVTFNPTNGKISINNSSLTFEIYLQSYNKEIASRPADWGIGYRLGFRRGKIQAVALPAGAGFGIIGEALLSLSAAPYYLLQLECPEAIENVTHPLLDDDYLSAFAKVILKDNFYTYQFDDNQNLVRKEFTYLAPHSIPFFTVRLVNAWGDTVNMQLMDWSLTIEVTEVVNSKTYAAISNTYARP